MLYSTKALGLVAASGDRMCEVVLTETELSADELLSEDKLSASGEIWVNVQLPATILFVSSELSSVQRVSKMASVGPLPALLSAVVVPVPVGLLLMTEVSTGEVTTALKLEALTFVRVLVSIAGDMVWASLVSTFEVVPTGIKFLESVLVLRV